MRKVQIYLALLLLLSLIAGCKNTNVVYIRDQANKVIEEYEINKKSNLKSGYYKRFDSSGRLLEEAHYDGGKLNGERKLFQASGKPDVIEHYLSGAYNGTFNSFYPNGKLNVEGVYLNGEMDGISKRYYDTGELMETTPFKSNEENGPFQEFFKNGKLKTEGVYQNGPKEQGELKMYNEDGELVKKMQCDNGECHTTWEKK